MQSVSVTLLLLGEQLCHEGTKQVHIYAVYHFDLLRGMLMNICNDGIKQGPQKQ